MYDGKIFNEGENPAPLSVISIYQAAMVVHHFETHAWTVKSFIEPSFLQRWTKRKISYCFWLFHLPCEESPKTKSTQRGVLYTTLVQNIVTRLSGADPGYQQGGCLAGDRRLARNFLRKPRPLSTSHTHYL